MAIKKQPSIFDDDVYVVTESGNSNLRDASTSLSPPEIELLVHIDGIATVAQIKARIKTLPVDKVIVTFENLKLRELIKTGGTTNALDFVEYFKTNSTAAPSPDMVTEATAEVADGTSTLLKDGYYVRIARRAATARKLAKDQIVSILVIEDEPHLVKFLRQFLTLEGFHARIATNRDEIVAAIRRAPLPDLVLLDVMLPDTDGFDILLKIRQHPALKSLPVVMLTAKATRDAVLKGLAGGADGYITKPFEAEVLVKAVKVVLGLPA
jgi:CheY-like chemotaxis protein